MWLEVWDEFELIAHETIEISPDRYLIPVKQHAVARGSGIEVAGEFFYTAEFDGGRIRRISLYGDRSPADAALREGASAPEPGGP